MVKNSRSMNLNILIMTAIAAFMSLSCSGDKAGEEDSPLASRPFISASAEDGDNGLVEAQVDTIALTVKFNFTGRTDFSAVPVAFSLNEGYSIEGGDGEVISLDLDNESVVTFIAKGASQSYTVSATGTTPFDIHAGVNLSYWLQAGGGLWAMDGSIRTKIQKLIDLGFDHFRIPVDESFMFKTDGTLNQTNLSMLTTGLDVICELGAKAIVDLHKLKNPDIFTSKTAEARFYECWKLLSSALSGYPLDAVAYELLNEPEDGAKSDLWNPILNNAIEQIRSTEKRRLIVIGSVGWQSYDQLNNLIIPRNDPNLIISFHYYNPMVLTHYGFDWSIGTFEYGLPSYPGCPVSEDVYNHFTDAERERFGWWYTTGQYFDAAKIGSQISNAYYAAKARDVRLYCGEFACSGKIGDNGTEAQQRLDWLRDVVTVCDKYDIPFCHWENSSSGFGFCFPNGNVSDTMVRIITGKE